MPDTRRYGDALKYVHLSTASTAINRSNQAKLHRVVVNDAASATLTISEGATASGGAIISILDCGTAGTYEYGIPTLSGLTVSLDGAADVTVVYE
jgi:hypothetical protein